jgi:hypothetical protein
MIANSIHHRGRRERAGGTVVTPLLAAVLALGYRRLVLAAAAGRLLTAFAATRYLPVAEGIGCEQTC